MSSPVRQEAATRQIPVAHQRSASGEHRIDRAREERPVSQPRLQATVTRQTARDERDPYADVPCTD